ncbi:NUDIX hydrolase [Risungbinella massiliensis]|uniref:NUDIX hydrolase n=1 Tax=Risungbinella massiliensis TaxID=1329796 RepID=UPI0005CBF5CA|nr:NUDIX domain-containing protein [Risungbinella massiliensis]
MENEIIKTFDEHGNELGVATRSEVHNKGYWHKTFHCWITSNENGIDYIHLQIRSEWKKDYPDLFDITAAGHILAHESIGDGIREVKEEIGIDVLMDELISMGVIKYCAIKDDFMDKELAHVFLYQSNIHLDEYNLQREEVSGIVKAKFDDFRELWLGEKEEISVEGFEMDDVGNKIPIQMMVNKNQFVPHDLSYYESIIELISKNLKEPE